MRKHKMRKQDKQALDAANRLFDAFSPKQFVVWLQDEIQNRNTTPHDAMRALVLYLTRVATNVDPIVSATYKPIGSDGAITLLDSVKEAVVIWRKKAEQNLNIV